MPNFYSDDLVSPSGERFRQLAMSSAVARPRFAGSRRSINLDGSDSRIVDISNDDAANDAAVDDNEDAPEWNHRRSYVNFNEIDAYSNDGDSQMYDHGEESNEIEEDQHEMIDRDFHNSDRSVGGDDEIETDLNASGDDTDKLHSEGLKELETLGLVDIGNLAAWSVTSSKQGFGVDNLRDYSPHTYWQSDGQLPHAVTIRFTKSVRVERISLFLNYLADESYTPSKITVYAGTGDHDIIEVKKFEMDSPIGWKHIVFKDIGKSGMLKCFLIKLFFLANHQNGKDTHLRCVKIMSPEIKSTRSINNFNGDGVGFTSLKLIRETVIR